MLESRLTHRLVTLLSILALGLAASACSGADTTGGDNGATPDAGSGFATEDGGNTGLPSTDVTGGGGDKDGTGGTEPCMPDCVGKMCGDDGCGASCGECEVDTLCDLAGSCVALSLCTDTCDGRECGTVCGEECGTCSDGSVCADFACVSMCTPDCGDRVCGDDGCGGSCGDCEMGTLCNVAGECVELTTCTPECDGKECGDDGCGELCGVCDTGHSCNDSGACEAVPCVASCDGKACGSDGCDGICGTCADDETCSAEGLCEEGPCTPDCGGKDCGDDGCGNQCGACGGGDFCDDDGQCVAVAVDPCDPNPCVSPPDDGCEDGGPTTYDAIGNCNALDDTYSCDYPYEVGECADDEICQGGECVEAPEPGEFSEDVSVLTEVVIQEANEPDDCCFDFDGDGGIDNGLVNLIGTLAPFLGDVDIDSSAAEAIDGGDIVIAFEAIGLDELVDDSQMGINGYVGYYDDDGALLIQPSSLNDDGSAVVSFEDGEVAGGVASIGPADFEASLPLGGTTLNLAIKDSRGEAELSAGPGGAYVDMNDGKLGGLISFADIINTLNMLAKDCECLDLDGGDMFDLTDEDSIDCSSAFDSSNANCNDDDGAICTTLAGISDNQFLVCLFGVGLIAPDIDTDFNGKNDHFSIGIRFTGEASSIDGVGEDQSPEGCSDCSGGGNPLSQAVFLALFAMVFAWVTRRRRV